MAYETVAAESSANATSLIPVGSIITVSLPSYEGVPISFQADTDNLSLEDNVLHTISINLNKHAFGHSDATSIAQSIYNSISEELNEVELSEYHNMQTTNSKETSALKFLTMVALRLGEVTTSEPPTDVSEISIPSGATLEIKIPGESDTYSFTTNEDGLTFEENIHAATKLAIEEHRGPFSGGVELVAKRLFDKLKKELSAKEIEYYKNAANSGDYIGFFTIILPRYNAIQAIAIKEEQNLNDSEEDGEGDE